MLKQRVKGQVKFVHYENGNLVYRCDDGFEFYVPTSDCGAARFQAQEKGILFMRWISRHMDLLEEGKSNG